MTWEDILKVADIGLYEEGRKKKFSRYETEKLVDDALEYLKEYLEGHEELKDYLHHGMFDYVYNSLINELDDDADFKDKLSLELLKYYDWHDDESLNYLPEIGPFSSRENERLYDKTHSKLKRVTMAFFGKYLTQKKWADKIEENISYYWRELSGV